MANDALNRYLAQQFNVPLSVFDGQGGFWSEMDRLGNPRHFVQQVINGYTNSFDKVTGDPLRPEVTGSAKDPNGGGTDYSAILQDKISEVTSRLTGQFQGQIQQQQSVMDDLRRRLMRMQREPMSAAGLNSLINARYTSAGRSRSSSMNIFDVGDDSGGPSSGVIF